MKLPPVIPAKSAKDRYFVGSSSGGFVNHWEIAGGATTQIPKVSQSHSSSFLADQNLHTPEDRDEATRAGVEAQ